MAKGILMMARPMPASTANAFGTDLHQFIDPLKIIGEKRWEQIPIEPWG
jgi:hypothetical protein